MSSSGSSVHRKNNMHKKLITIAGLIGVGVMGRLLPHLPNATPIAAIALAGSKYVGRIWAVVIPIAAMLISDAVIGWYDWRILVSVYISFALIGLLSLIVRTYQDVVAVSLVVLCAPILFFLVTNFAVWMFSPWYEKSFWGLLYCYQLGLPFLRNMLIGDIIYATTLLGFIELASMKARTQTKIRTPCIWSFLIYTTTKKNVSSNNYGEHLTLTE